MSEFEEISTVFKLAFEEKEEILRHKWVLGERLDKEVDFDFALLSWIRNHRDDWYSSRLKELGIDIKNLDSNRS